MIKEQQELLNNIPMKETPKNGRRAITPGLEDIRKKLMKFDYTPEDLKFFAAGIRQEIFARENQ